MSSSYQKFLVLLTKWPANLEKKTRDYGHFLRTLLKEQGSGGLYFPESKANLEQQINCLFRIVQNKYGAKYATSQRLGASGLDRDTIGVVLTDDFIDYFNQSQKLSNLFFK